MWSLLATPQQLGPAFWLLTKALVWIILASTRREPIVNFEHGLAPASYRGIRNTRLNKSRMFEAALRRLKDLSPHYFERGLSITMNMVPHVVVRDVLDLIRKSECTIADRDDVIQFLVFAAPIIERSSSQLSQDIWALWETGGKQNGFFVEFGATDGKNNSNSYFLEKEMNWKGILAEPNPSFAQSIRCNRSCFISDKCVHPRSGKRIEFLAGGELSRIASIDPQDGHERSQFPVVLVETISLNDLLIEGQAPKDIDFLSIDTEGSEFEILSYFDFNKWNIQCIAVEHNYTKTRERIFELLCRHGYRRKWPGLGYVDDWYVRT